MLSSMCFEAINPTVSNSITELFFLPVQNVLHGIKQDTLVSYVVTKRKIKVGSHYAIPLADRDALRHQRPSSEPISQYVLLPFLSVMG